MEKKNRIWKKFLVVMIAVFSLTLLLPGIATQLGTMQTVQAASAKKPGKVTVSSVKSTVYNKAVVSWKKVSNATSYRIYYKQNGASKWITLKDVNAKTTSYTHTSSSKYPLKAGKKYLYTVRAYNKNGKVWGSYDTKGKAVTILPVLGKVKLVSISSPADNKVTIKWNKTSNADKYRVYYKSADSSKWKSIKDLDSTKTSYTHKSSAKFPLVSGQRYSYTVKAYNSKSKKWGSYNTTGLTVMVQNKSVPIATPTPTAAPKPTATPTPKPTATPVPTATPTPQPTATPTPQISGYEKLAKYILTNGSINNKGNRFIKSSLYSQGVKYSWGIIYNTKENVMDFQIISDGQGIQDALVMKVVMNPSVANATYTFLSSQYKSGFELRTIIDSKTYTGDTSIDFEVVSTCRSSASI